MIANAAFYDARRANNKHIDSIGSHEKSENGPIACEMGLHLAKSDRDNSEQSRVGRDGAVCDLLFVRASRAAECTIERGDPPARPRPHAHVGDLPLQSCDSKQQPLPFGHGCDLGSHAAETAEPFGDTAAGE